MTSTTLPKNRSVGNVRKHGTAWQARVSVAGVNLSKIFPTKSEARLWLYGGPIRQDRIQSSLSWSVRPTRSCMTLPHSC